MSIQTPTKTGDLFEASITYQGVFAFRDTFRTRRDAVQFLIGLMDQHEQEYKLLCVEGALAAFMDAKQHAVMGIETKDMVYLDGHRYAIKLIKEVHDVKTRNGSFTER